MGNKEKQQKLDVEKWLASEKCGYDRAGSMDWCNYCKAQKQSTTQGKVLCANKEKDTTTCATAYNKMRKARDKEIAEKHGVI